MITPHPNDSIGEPQRPDCTSGDVSCDNPPRTQCPITCRPISKKFGHLQTTQGTEPDNNHDGHRKYLLLICVGLASIIAIFGVMAFWDAPGRRRLTPPQPGATTTGHHDDGRREGEELHVEQDRIGDVRHRESEDEQDAPPPTRTNGWQGEAGGKKCFTFMWVIMIMFSFFMVGIILFYGFSGNSLDGSTTFLSVFYGFLFLLVFSFIYPIARGSCCCKERGNWCNCCKFDYCCKTPSRRAGFEGGLITLVGGTAAAGTAVYVKESSSSPQSADKKLDQVFGNFEKRAGTKDEAVLTMGNVKEWDHVFLENENGDRVKIEDTDLGWGEDIDLNTLTDDEFEKLNSNGYTLMKKVAEHELIFITAIQVVSVIVLMWLLVVICCVFCNDKSKDGSKCTFEKCF